MYTLVGKDEQVHQMYYVQSDSGQNINDINLTVSIPNGVIVEKNKMPKNVKKYGSYEFIS